MAISTSNGSKFYISGTGSTPSTQTSVATASAYAALTWIEVQPVESIGQFGDTANTVTFAALGDARMRKRKGVRDAGDIVLSVAHDPLDVGQKALITADATEFTYAFKVLLADGADANDTDSVFYFRGLVSGVPIEPGGSDNIVKRSITILIDSAIVAVASIAVT